MATINIYNCKITKDRNAKVDYIDDYLSTIQPVEFENVQYQQMQLKMTIKLAINQSEVANPIGNYLVINQDNKNYYFFIESAKWRSKTCVEFEIAMDTINTFVNDFTFNKKTNVVRTHKDRYKKEVIQEKETIYLENVIINGVTKTQCVHVNNAIGNAQVTQLVAIAKNIALLGSLNCDQLKDEDGNYTNTIVITAENTQTEQGELYEATLYYDIEKVMKVIDRVNENINPILYGKNIGECRDIKSDKDWFLIYQSSQIDTERYNNPIDLYLQSNDRITVSIPTAQQAWSGSWTITPNDLESGYYYWIDYDKEDSRKVNSIDCDVVLTANDLYLSKYPKCAQHIGRISSSKGWFNSCIMYKTTDGRIATRCAVYDLDYNQSIKPNGPDKVHDGNITFTSTNSFVIYKTKLNDISINTRKEILKTGTRIYKEEIVYTSKEISSIDELKKNSTYLIKILKLPYYPKNYTLDGSNLKLSNDVFYKEIQDNTSAIAVTNVNKQPLTYNSSLLSSTITTALENPLYTLSENLHKLPSYNDLRSDLRETKLLSSEFYLPKFIYDSFEFPFQLERVNGDIEHDKVFSFDYNVSHNFNSVFMFTFNDYICDYNPNAYSNQLIISRSNEMPLYTDSYIDYMRNGYNYEMKAKEKQQQGSWIQTGIGIASTITGVVLAATGYGAAFGASLIVGGVTSIASGISGNIINEQKSSIALENKLNDLMARGVSVRDNNDVDMMSIYANNRAKLMVYEPTQNMKRILGDMFYYCGYNDSTQHIPDETSRIWFNFISCNPVFNEEFSTPYQDYLVDIKSRYATGVTTYHRNKINNQWVYDWDQEKENWESILFE